MSDTKTFFSKNHGWSGIGERNGRWAMIIEKDGTVSYAEVEQKPREIKVKPSSFYRYIYQSGRIKHPG